MLPISIKIFYSLRCQCFNVFRKIKNDNIITNFLNKTMTDRKLALDNGRKFEDKTNIPLLEMGYIRKKYKKNKNTYDYYLELNIDDKKIIFVMQSGLKSYIKYKYDIDLFRCPDEAYIVEYTDGRKIIKILEKKEQNVEGSVETKLWAGPSLKREYEIMLGDIFEVEYGFCVNDFLHNKILSNNKKYVILNQILNENNIKVLYGDNDDYRDTLESWINSF
jgi:hypothetical protein